VSRKRKRKAKRTRPIECAFCLAPGVRLARRSGRACCRSCLRLSATRAEAVLAEATRIRRAERTM